MFDISFFEMLKILILFFLLAFSMGLSVFLYKTALLLPSMVYSFYQSKYDMHTEFCNERNWVFSYFGDISNNSKCVRVAFRNVQTKDTHEYWVSFFDLKRVLIMNGYIPIDSIDKKFDEEDGE